jgi:hypothetical protein
MYVILKFNYLFVLYLKAVSPNMDFWNKINWIEFLSNMQLEGPEDGCRTFLKNVRTDLPDYSVTSQKTTVLMKWIIPGLHNKVWK